MAFYAVDVQNHAVERVTKQYKFAAHNKVLLIEAVSARQAWSKASRAADQLGSADYDWCRHRYCSACEECSVTKRYSDYWICHCCGELNRRVQNLHYMEVRNGSRKN